VTETNSLSQSTEIGTEAGLSVEAVSASVKSSMTTTESNSISKSNQFSSEVIIPGEDLAPSYKANGYMVYKRYDYDLVKWDTRNEEVVWVKTYSYYVPLGIKGVKA
jgi:hypothetical protein